MDQQLNTHAVLIENLGLIPAPMWQIETSVTLIPGDLTPSVASMDTAHTHTIHLYTCTQNTHMQKVCRFKTPKSYALRVGGSASS